MMIVGWCFRFPILLTIVLEVTAFLPNAFHLQPQNQQRNPAIIPPRAERNIVQQQQQQQEGDNGLKQDEISWKLRLSPDTPWISQFAWKIQTQLKRWNHLLTQANDTKAPWVMLPSDSNPQRQAVMVLEAYHHQQRIAKFGFTVHPGPGHPLFNQAMNELWPHWRRIPFKNRNTTSSNNNKNEEDDEDIAVRAAAVIYMYVEPAYRKLGLGRVALQMMRTIHALQQCHVTVLVADDDGTGKLVRWYQQPEQGSFHIAPPYLQAFLGNPNQQFGVAMLAPTSTAATTLITGTELDSSSSNNNNNNNHYDTGVRNDKLPLIQWW